MKCSQCSTLGIVLVACFPLAPGAVPATIGLDCALWWLRVKFKWSEKSQQRKDFLSTSCEILRFTLESHIWYTPLRNVDENSRKKQQTEEESKEALKTTEVRLVICPFVRGGSFMFLCSENSIMGSFLYYVLKPLCSAFLSFVPSWPEFLVAMSQCIWFCFV